MLRLPTKWVLISAAFAAALIVAVTFDVVGVSEAVVIAIVALCWVAWWQQWYRRK
jgi:hypothetical protein